MYISWVMMTSLGTLLEILFIKWHKLYVLIWKKLYCKEKQFKKIDMSYEITVKDPNLT